MKLKLITVLYILSLFAGCTSPQENNKGKTPKAEDTSDNPSPVCYTYATKADTILLTIIHLGGAIKGTLVYNLDGKDKNTGTIEGSMKGDILLADYSFMSEGIQSVRQIAFKRSGNGFIEGYGEIEMHNDTAHFKNPEAFTFNNSMKLVETACQ